MAEKIKGIIQIIHGMSEHKGRYLHFFKYFTERGYLVFLHEHLHHGNNVAAKEELGIFQSDFPILIKEQKAYTEKLKKDYPDIPFFIFGHSMGSFIAQEHMKTCWNEIDGYIFCGSCYKQPFLWKAGEIASYLLDKIYRNRRAYIIKKLVFLNSNSKTRSEYYYNENSWLSRDVEEVKRYCNDKLCDFTYSSTFYTTFFKFLNSLYSENSFKNISKKLPIMIISGDMDPVGKFGKGVIELEKFYNRIGFEDVTCHLYKNARHELHNEINRDEVFSDIEKWLETKI
ncbi:alpha/beta fold hydrolase [Fusobacterium varium]|jgi:alpha-beta hydrolase superfamily lysophospholipase